LIYGKVKWFNTAKGYGFIERDGERDVFVHYSNIDQEGFEDLKQGQFVSFQMVDTEKGPQARNVLLVDGPIPGMPQEFASPQGGSKARPGIDDEPMQEVTRG
jgi:CspA family cold shock protein